MEFAKKFRCAMIESGSKGLLEFLANTKKIIRIAVRTLRKRDATNLRITKLNNLPVCLLAAMIFFTSMFFAQKCLAGNGENVGGFAWSENIGWVSFNNVAVEGVAGGGGSKSYGVKIHNNGLITGYAWSENIGWISFNEDDLTGCPSASCKAQVSTTPSGGNYAVSGWARVLSAKNEPTNNGGWDGWIKLAGTAQNGSPYKVYIDSDGDFHGFAWSDMVLGWLNFNNPSVPYKVHTSMRFAPQAKIGCGGTCPDGHCDANPGSTWIMYPPTGDCFECAYKVSNKSEGDVQCTNWKLINPSSGATVWEYTGQGKQDLTFPPNIPIGTFNLKLTVSSVFVGNPNCSATNYTSEIHALQIKREILAKPKCTLDNPNPTEENPSPNPTWYSCDDNNFKKKVFKSDMVTVYVADDNSQPSADASEIISWEWTFTADGIVTTASGSSSSFTAGKSNVINLYVTDNAGRHNCKIITINSKTLPKWQEVNPIGMLWHYFVANISKIFATSKDNG